MGARIVQFCVAVIGFVVLTAALLALGGYPVQGALSALWGGSLGSWYAVTSSTLVRSVPLMLAGTAVAIAFRAGVLNIGAEGQLLLGATAATSVAFAFPAGGHAVTVVALVAGAFAGAAWAAIAAVLRRQFGVLEVISTIMLNFVALHLVSLLVRGPLQEPTHAYPQTSPIPASMHLGRIPGAGRLHLGLVIAVILLLAIGWVLRRTAVGFRLLAVGENPVAAASAGLIDPRRVAFTVLVFSGALAGLAGAIEVFGVTFALYEDISPGYGYSAIAVALLAGLDPWRVILSAFGLAALEAGAGAMQRDAGVPSTLAVVIEALLILIAVSGHTWRGLIARRRTAFASSHD
jgi:simple sugar transport system permease protein